MPLTLDGREISRIALSTDSVIDSLLRSTIAPLKSLFEPLRTKGMIFMRFRLQVAPCRVQGNRGVSPSWTMMKSYLQVRLLHWYRCSLLGILESPLTFTEPNMPGYRDIRQEVELVELVELPSSAAAAPPARKKLAMARVDEIRITDCFLGRREVRCSSTWRSMSSLRCHPLYLCLGGLQARQLRNYRWAQRRRPWQGT